MIFQCHMHWPRWGGLGFSLCPNACSVAEDRLSHLEFFLLSLIITSAYIRCPHSGTSALELCARLRCCASLHHHHHKKNRKKIAHAGDRACTQSLQQIWSPTLIHSATEFGLRVAEGSSFSWTLQECFCATWDNGVSEWQSSFKLLDW